MKPRFLALFVLALLTSAAGWYASTPATARQAGAEQNFFEALQVGQAVMLEERAGRYRIQLMPTELTQSARGPLQRIASIGRDHVTVRQETGALTTVTRIPVYSVISIVELRSRP